MTSQSSLLRKYIDILNEAETQAVPTGTAPTAQSPVDPLYQKYNQIRGTLRSYDFLTSTQPGDRQTYGNVDPQSKAMIDKMRADLATAEKQLISKGYTKQQLDEPFQQKTKSEPLDQNQPWQESDIKEGPPPGVGPNAVAKSAVTAQQPDQDMFTKMLPSMGNKVIDQMAGLAPQLQKVLQDFTPGSPYYEKNVKGNPKLEKAAADTLAQAGQYAQDPNALKNYIADIKQRFNQALITPKGASGTSTEYDQAADQLGLPKVNESKSLLEHIEEVENDGPLQSNDYFHIELAEDEGIETWVIAEWSESVLIEADKDTLKLLEEHGCTFYDELTEAEYQGRSVPLGKPMSGDVKKSKVYVKKPNGKVVKVNFGDKKMTIKKSNPKRRKSFRARHNCQNPGPRWKARYWSCRAW